jgi:hypothetical protein
MLAHVIRFDSISRPATTLKPQPCNWAGMKGREMLCFVPAQNRPAVEVWRGRLQDHHGQSLVENHYWLDIPGVADWQTLNWLCQSLYATDNSWQAAEDLLREIGLANLTSQADFGLPIEIRLTEVSGPVKIYDFNYFN